ncbi:MAG: DUF1761 domain-containing protein [Pseudomonadales bacterium]|nr:DUF1761 domain-containing protein [Pseudomonadales bacterium]
MPDLMDLNVWAIGVSTLAGFVLGGLWYGPLFGAAWLAAIGKTEDELTPSATPFVVSFFTALLTALVLAGLINALGINSLSGGVVLGLITGVGFIATAMASDTAFCGWGMRLFLIQSGYRVSYSVIMGGILAVWQ